MSRYFISFAAAGALALAVSVHAQDPPQSPPQTQPKSATAAQPAQTVTVEGCLVKEEDVPGRKPNVAERAGIMEDYILTSIKMIKGTEPRAAGAPAARPGEAPTGTTGMKQTMYQVKGIEGDQLKSLVGKRVQIEGTFDDLSELNRPPTPEHLPDIKGTAIKSVAGECPAKQ